MEKKYCYKFTTKLASMNSKVFLTILLLQWIAENDNGKSKMTVANFYNMCIIYLIASHI